MRFEWMLLAFVCLAPAITGAADATNYEARITVDATQRTGRISPYIYGQYLEHVERKDECIYPSLWDDQSPFADRSGLRRDVIAAARELKVPVVRWPGGCFADVYHWEDGIGPRASRPVRQNQHWGGEEPNSFGTDEFLRWCDQVGTEAYINANLGTGTLEECLRWLEYCNGSRWSEQGKRRKGNGHPSAYDVKFWGIGNETFGKWEAGHMDAKTYSETLARWASAVRKKDPGIKIMAVGSMSADDPEWDRAVLDKAGHLINYLTIHNYGVSMGERESFESVAFTPVYFEQRFRKMLAVVDEFAHRRGKSEPIRLALDEWNIRHYENGKLNRKSARTQQDAVFAAGVLNTMIRLSPRVAMANYVFLVNGNGVMLVNSNQVVKTPLFHLFKQYGEWMQGDVVDTTVECLTTQPQNLQAHHSRYKFPADFHAPRSPYLDVVAAVPKSGELIIAVVNRHGSSAADVELRLPKGYTVEKVWSLHHEDVLAANTFETPNRVQPRIKVTAESAAILPPHSVSLIRCKK